jgi:hypothetical protein
LALGAEDPEMLIGQGIKLRKEGQDARAEGYFRRAYELAATPRTAAQLGLVELAVHDFLNAEAHLSEALAGHDAWIRQNARVLEESRDVARQNLLRVEIVGAPRGATLSVAGEKPRSMPPEGILWTAPEQPATVRVEAPGRRPMVVQVSGAAGQIQRVVVELPLLDAAPAPSGPPALVTRDEGISTTEPASSGRALRIAGITTAIVGVASCVVGVVLYQQGTTKLDDYQAAIRSDGKIPWNSADENWEAERNLGLGFLIAGGVAVAGGVTLFLIGHHAEHDQVGSGQFSFVSGARSGFLSYRGSF